MASRIAVIVDREGLGDSLLKLPMLRAIKRACPGSEVWWIASHITAMSDTLLAQTEHLIANVVTDLKLNESPRCAMARLKKLPRFDLVFDTRTRILDVVLARTGLRPREFYACLPGYFLSHRRPSGMPVRPKSVGQRAMSMAIAAFGAGADGSGSLPISPEARAAAERALPSGPTYVGLAPGSREARKNWPLDRFVQVAAMLAANGHIPVFILGPFERRWTDELRARAPEALFPEIESVDRTLSLISRLAVMLAGDSGAGHMAASLDVPLVSLFGPTDAERWRPFGGAVQVIRAQDFGGESMETIPIRPVLAALLGMLASPAARPVRS